jgi:hypothetical protein
MKSPGKESLTTSPTSDKRNHPNFKGVFVSPKEMMKEGTNKSMNTSQSLLPPHLSSDNPSTPPKRSPLKGGITLMGSPSHKHFSPKYKENKASSNESPAFTESPADSNIVLRNIEEKRVLCAERSKGSGKFVRKFNIDPLHGDNDANKIQQSDVREKYIQQLQQGQQQHPQQQQQQQQQQGQLNVEQFNQRVSNATNTAKNHTNLYGTRPLPPTPTHPSTGSRPPPPPLPPRDTSLSPTTSSAAPKPLTFPPIAFTPKSSFVARAPIPKSQTQTQTRPSPNRPNNKTVDLRKNTETAAADTPPAMSQIMEKMNASYNSSTSQRPSQRPIIIDTQNCTTPDRSKRKP